MAPTTDPLTGPLAEGSTNKPSSLDFDGVISQVAEDDRQKWDVLVPRDVLYLEGGKLCFPPRYAHVPAGRPAVLTPTNWAQVQLCQRLGIPPGYFAKCPVHLKDAQANHWLRRGGASVSELGEDPRTDSLSLQRKRRRLRAAQRPTLDWLLRSNGDRVRAVLSDRYVRIDNARIVRALAPILSERYQHIQWFSLSDETMHLRVVDHRLRRDVLPGDGVVAGLHIGQSEVGRRRITVDALVYRLVCKNGLVRLVRGHSIFERRHVGGRIEEAAFAEDLELAVREALMSASGFIERMASSTQIHLENPMGTIATIAFQWRLSFGQRDAIAAALLAEGQIQSGQDETLYGLVNALTFVAQTLGPEDRVDLETRAGQLLESGPPASSPSAAATRAKRERSSAVQTEFDSRSGFALPRLSPAMRAAGTGAPATLTPATAAVGSSALRQPAATTLSMDALFGDESTLQKEVG